MTVKLFSFFPLRRLGLALLACSSASHAAMLGDIQIRSALGERLDATVTVAAADDEDLSSNCFRLVTPQDDTEGSILRRAHLVYQHEVNGGRLIIRGEESVQEPLLTVSVRVKCPGEEERVFQRDYRLLLDPREYRQTYAGESPSRSTNKAAIRRKLPALGSVWLSEEGDSVAKIAASYYPKDKARQQLLVQAIYELNPDLPQNTNARLGSDWRLQLPSPVAAAETAAPKAQPRFEAAQLEAVPRLTLDNVVAAVPAAAPATTVSAPGEFRLRLSDSNLDTQRKSTLSPDQTLQLRERLLSLESDEQAAQMLQLKYQVAELEKQLSSLRGNASASASAESGVTQIIDRSEEKTDSWWWILVALLVTVPVAALLGLRRWQRRGAEQDEPFSMISPSTAYLGNANYGAGDNYGRSNSMGGLDTREIGTPIHRNESEEWHSDEMDVVSPGNVTEEAQLLLDHGLTPQAINLLSHEINQFPAALALWMKLFEIFVRNAMPEAYQERAVAFRLQFASDSLWQKVQEMGRELDPANPLYRSIDMASDVALQLDANSVSASTDADLAFAQSLQSSINLDLPQLPEDDVEKPLDIELIEASAADGLQFLHPDEEVDAIEIVSLDPLDKDEERALSSEPELDLGQELVFHSAITPPAASPQTSESSAFQSDDPQLQAVAQLIDAGQRKEAFKQLEEMLYKGNMSQRLTASKWLDKMIGKFDNA